MLKKIKPIFRLFLLFSIIVYKLWITSRRSTAKKLMRGKINNYPCKWVFFPKNKTI